MTFLQGEWVMRTGRKKKHQTPVTHGIDSIITSAQTAPSHATITSQSKQAVPRPTRNRGSHSSFLIVEVNFFADEN